MGVNAVACESKREDEGGKPTEAGDKGGNSEVDRSAPQFVVLVLGMVFSSEKQAKELEDSSPAWRDYNRLMALQKVLPSAEIHSVTHNNHSLLTEKTSHNLNIGRRGASTLHWKLKAGLQFDAVICDYFRFPCEYMREAYEGLLTFLQELQSKGRIAPAFKLFLPNLQLLKIFKDEQLMAAFEHMHNLDVEETRQLHPLYLATDRLEKEIDGVNRFLSGYCNETELKQLDPEFPFLVCSGWVHSFGKGNQVVAKAIRNQRKEKYNRALEQRRRQIREQKGLKVKSHVRQRPVKRATRKDKSTKFVPRTKAVSVSLKRKRCVIPEPVEFFSIVERSATFFSKRLIDGRYKKTQELQDVVHRIGSNAGLEEINRPVLEQLEHALQSMPILRARLFQLLPRMEKRGAQQKVDFIRKYIGEVNRRYPPHCDVNRSFTNILVQYKNGDIPGDTVLKRIAILFSRDEDLVLGFTRLSDERVILQSEKVVLSCLSEVIGSRVKKRIRNAPCAQSEEATLLLKIKHKLNNEEAWLNVLKCFQLFTSNLLSPLELECMLSPLVPLPLLDEVNLLVASSVRTERKVPFSAEEDLLLVDAVCTWVAKATMRSMLGCIEGKARSQARIPWSAIATSMKSRTGAQCRMRWEEHLDPSINRGLWTAAEDMKLLGLYIDGCTTLHVLRTKLVGRTRRQIEARLEVIKELYKSLRNRHDSQEVNHASSKVLPSLEEVPMIPREALLEIAELLRHPAELEQFLAHFHLDFRDLSYALETNLQRHMRAAI